MKNIYIIDIFEKETTGYTTYKENLFSILKGIENIALNHIILYHPSDEFVIQSKNSVTTFLIPNVSYDIMVLLLRLHITDSADNIFFQNYTPSYPILSVLRKTFKFSKILFVVHDFIWISQVLGDVNKFMSLIAKPNKKQEYSLLYNSHEDGVLTYEIVDKIICLNQSTYNLLNQFYKIHKNKLELIPNGAQNIDCTKPSKADARIKLNLEGNSKIILFVGRFSESKGSYALVKSFEKIVSFDPYCRLVIAGNFISGDLKFIKSSIKSKIIFLGQIDKGCLDYWYKVADIGVISTYYEQCSYSCIEMMMHGLPIVASNGYGIDCMFSDENAIIASIGNRNNNDEFSENLANAMIGLLGNKEIRDQMGYKSKQTYEQKYNIYQMQLAYQSLINKI